MSLFKLKLNRQLYLFILTATLGVTNIFSQTVFVTNTGKKYHAENCRYLSNSANQLTLTDAKTRGYDPCSVCKPSSNQTTTNTVPQNNTMQETNTAQDTSSATQCTGTTQAGKRCSRKTKSKNGRCYQHGGN